MSLLFGNLFGNLIIRVKKSTYENRLTLRREAGVKLTPDPINCLILKNRFNLRKPNFVTFLYFSIGFNL